MAQYVFNAQVNLVAPANIKEVATRIQSELSNIRANIAIDVSNEAIPGVDRLNKALGDTLINLRAINTQAVETAGSIGRLAQSYGAVSSNATNSTTAMANSATTIKQVSTTLDGAASAAERFGQQAGLATRRFAAFTLASGTIIGLAIAFKNSLESAVEFERGLIRLSQVAGTSQQGIKEISDKITELGTGLGVSSKDLLSASFTFRQAGLSIDDTKTALEALAKAALTPNFDNITRSVDGAIAIMSQFKIEAKDLEGVLSGITAVSANYAVSSQEIVDAVKRAGTTFKAAGGNINEFVALFASVRSTTRESAEAIATGLQTIFARIQRKDTIENLKQLGINLRYTKEEAKDLGDLGLENQFVGAFEAVKRLSEGLRNIRPTDQRYSGLVEQLGGYRELDKLIPALQNVSKQQEALNIAQYSGNAIAASAGKAQDSYLQEIKKLGEALNELGRTILANPGFQTLVQGLIIAAKAATGLVSALTPLIPLLTTLAVTKIALSVPDFSRGLVGGLAKSPPQKGIVTQFSEGGVVPGHGYTDSHRADLMPGEFVIKQASAKKIGYGALHAMNTGGIIERAFTQHYAQGGVVGQEPLGYASGGPIPIRNYSDNKSLPQKITPVLENIVKETGLPINKIIQYVQIHESLPDIVSYTKGHQGNFEPDTRSVNISAQGGLHPTHTVINHEVGHGVDWALGNNGYFASQYGGSALAVQIHELSRDYANQSAKHFSNAAPEFLNIISRQEEGFAELFRHSVENNVSIPGTEEHVKTFRKDIFPQLRKKLGSSNLDEYNTKKYNEQEVNVLNRYQDINQLLRKQGRPQGITNDHGRLLNSLVGDANINEGARIFFTTPEEVPGLSSRKTSFTDKGIIGLTEEGGPGKISVEIPGGKPLLDLSKIQEVNSNKLLLQAGSRFKILGQNRLRLLNKGGDIAPISPVYLANGGTLISGGIFNGSIYRHLQNIQNSTQLPINKLVSKISFSNNPLADKVGFYSSGRREVLLPDKLPINKIQNVLTQNIGKALDLHLGNGYNLASESGEGEIFGKAFAASRKKIITPSMGFTALFTELVKNKKPTKLISEFRDYISKNTSKTLGNVLPQEDLNAFQVYGTNPEQEGIIQSQVNAIVNRTGLPVGKLVKQINFQDSLTNISGATEQTKGFFQGDKSPFVGINKNVINFPDTLLHEIGHGLDYSLGKNQYATSLISQERDIGRSYGLARFNTPEVIASKSLGYYSYVSQPEEGFAELFKHYVQGNVIPGTEKIASDFGTHILPKARLQLGDVGNLEERLAHQVRFGYAAGGLVINAPGREKLIQEQILRITKKTGLPVDKLISGINLSDKPGIAFQPQNRIVNLHKDLTDEDLAHTLTQQVGQGLDLHLGGGKLASQSPGQEQFYGRAFVNQTKAGLSPSEGFSSLFTNFVQGKQENIGRAFDSAILNKARKSLGDVRQDTSFKLSPEIPVVNPTDVNIQGGTPEQYEILSKQLQYIVDRTGLPVNKLINQIKLTKRLTGNLGGTARGRFYPDSQNIDLNSTLEPEQLRETLTHEIGHGFDRKVIEDHAVPPLTKITATVYGEAYGKARLVELMQKKPKGPFSSDFLEYYGSRNEGFAELFRGYVNNKIIPGQEKLANYFDRAFLEQGRSLLGDVGDPKKRASLREQIGFASGGSVIPVINSITPSSNKKIKDILAKIQDKFEVPVDSIISKVNVHDASTYFQPFGRSININAKQKDLEHAISHEFGHGVDFALGNFKGMASLQEGSTANKFGQTYANIASASHLLPNQPEEGFAELFSHYITGKGQYPFKQGYLPAFTEGLSHSFNTQFIPDARQRLGFDQGGEIPQSKQTRARVKEVNKITAQPQTKAALQHFNELNRGGIVYFAEGGSVLDILKSKRLGLSRGAALTERAIALSNEDIKQQLESVIPKDSTFLASGSEALVLKAPDGDVIRVALTGDKKTKRRRPFTGRPELPEVLQPNESHNVGKFLVEKLPFVEPLGKARGEAPPRFYDDANFLRDSLKQRGYQSRDLIPSNIGLLGNKPIFIDPGDISPLFNPESVSLSAETELAPVKRKTAGFINGGQIKFYAQGGASTDTVPAMLTPGEFVLKRAAAHRIGLPNLLHMNTHGELPGYAEGGIVHRAGGSTDYEKAVSTDAGRLQVIRGASQQQVSLGVPGDRAEGIALAQLDAADKKVAQARVLQAKAIEARTQAEQRADTELDKSRQLQAEAAKRAANADAARAKAVEAATKLAELPAQATAQKQAIDTQLTQARAPIQASIASHQQNISTAQQSINTIDAQVTQRKSALETRQSEFTVQKNTLASHVKEINLAQSQLTRDRALVRDPESHLTNNQRSQLISGFGSREVEIAEDRVAAKTLGRDLNTTGQSLKQEQAEIDKLTANKAELAKTVKESNSQIKTSQQQDAQLAKQAKTDKTKVDTTTFATATQLKREVSSNTRTAGREDAGAERLTEQSKVAEGRSQQIVARGNAREDTLNAQADAKRQSAAVSTNAAGQVTGFVENQSEIDKKARLKAEADKPILKPQEVTTVNYADLKKPEDLLAATQKQLIATGVSPEQAPALAQQKVTEVRQASQDANRFNYLANVQRSKAEITGRNLPVIQSQIRDLNEDIEDRKPAVKDLYNQKVSNNIEREDINNTQRGLTQRTRTLRQAEAGGRISKADAQTERASILSGNQDLNARRELLAGADSSLRASIDAYKQELNSLKKLIAARERLEKLYEDTLQNQQIHTTKAETLTQSAQTASQRSQVFQDQKGRAAGVASLPVPVEPAKFLDVIAPPGTLRRSLLPTIGRGLGAGAFIGAQLAQNFLAPEPGSLTESNVGAHTALSATAGGIQGAVGGAVTASFLFPGAPLVAAAAGVVGAIGSVVSAFKQAAQELKQIQITKDVTSLNQSFNNILSSNTPASLEDKDNINSKISSLVTHSTEQATSNSSRFLGFGFNPNTFKEQYTKFSAQNLGGAIPNAISVLNKEIIDTVKATKINGVDDNKNIVKTLTGQVASNNEPLIKLIAQQNPNKSRDTIINDIVGKPVKEAVKTQSQNNAAEANFAQAQRLVTAFKILTDAVSSAALTFETLQQNANAIFSDRPSYTGLTGVAQFGQNRQEFEQATARLGGQLGNGPAAQDLTKSANAVSQISEVLRPALLEAFRGAPLQPEDVSKRLTNSINRQLTDNGVNAEDDTVKQTITNIITSLNSEDISKQLKDSGGDVGKLSDKLLASSSPSLDAITKNAQLLTSYTNSLGQAFETLRNKSIQTGIAIDRLADIRLTGQRIQAENTVQSQFLGRGSATDLLSLQQLQAPFTERVQRLAGTTDVDDIVRQLGQTNTEKDQARDALNKNAGQNTLELNKRFSDLALRASNLNDALALFADTTRSAAGIQEKLSRLEEQRLQKSNFLLNFIGSSPEQQVQTNRGLQLSQSAVQFQERTGQPGLQQFAHPDQALIIQTLNQLGNIKSPVLGGRSGAGAAEFLANGFLQPNGRPIVQGVNDAGEEAKLREQLVTAAKDAATAQAGLITNQKTLQDNFFLQLGQNQATFLERLNNNLTQAQKQNLEGRKLGAQLQLKDPTEVVKKATDLQNVFGPDVSLKYLNENRDKLSTFAKTNDTSISLLDSREKLTNAIQPDIVKQFSSSVGDNVKLYSLENIEGLLSKLKTIAPSLSTEDIQNLRPQLVNIGKNNDEVGLANNVQKVIDDVLKNSSKDADLKRLEAYEALPKQNTQSFNIDKFGATPRVEQQKILDTISSINNIKFDDAKLAIQNLNNEIANLDKQINSLVGNISTTQSIAKTSPVNTSVSESRTAPTDVVANVKDLGPDIKDIQAKATGGAIQPRGTDTVPAVLTPGEFVINQDSAKKIGYAKLTEMNKVRGYAEGGEVNPYGEDTDETIRRAKNPYGDATSNIVPEAQRRQAVQAEEDAFVGPQLPNKPFLPGIGAGLSDAQRRQLLPPDTEQVLNPPLTPKQAAVARSREAIKKQNNAIAGVLPGLTSPGSLTALTLAGLNAPRLNFVSQANNLAQQQLLAQAGGSQSVREQNAIGVNSLRQQAVYDEHRYITNILPGVQQTTRKLIDLRQQKLARDFRRRRNQEGLRRNPTIDKAIDIGEPSDKFFAATGGIVPGVGNTDSVHAMLTPGEFVLTKKAVASIGLDNVRQANKFAEGGLVGGGTPGNTEGASLDFTAFTGAVDTLSSTLNNFVNKMGGVTESLKNLSGLTISMNATHSVDVNINGAEILAQLEPSIKEMVVSKANEAISQAFKKNLPDLGPISFDTGK